MEIHHLILYFEGRIGSNTYLSNFFVFSSDLVVLVFDFVFEFDQELLLDISNSNFGELFETFSLGFLVELFQLIIEHWRAKGELLQEGALKAIVSILLCS